MQNYYIYIYDACCWSNHSVWCCGMRLIPVSFCIMASFEVAVIFAMLLVISFAQHHQELPHYAPVPLQHHHGEVEVEEYHHAHPKYEFKYGVKDTHTHDIKEQHEKRDGDKVEGYYKLLEADGTTRTVHYTADKHRGFQAQVVRSGHAIHPVHQQH